MRLSVHTDYGLRILIALASVTDRLMTIEELAQRHRISRNHLMKVANSLVTLGLVEGVRGRSGGLRLARDAASIRMGTVVRSMETDLQLVDCLGDKSAACVFSGVCGLTGMLRRAMDAFFDELDRLTLADLVRTPAALRGRLGIAA